VTENVTDITERDCRTSSAKCDHIYVVKIQVCVFLTCKLNRSDRQWNVYVIKENDISYMKQTA